MLNSLSMDNPIRNFISHNYKLEVTNVNKFIYDNRSKNFILQKNNIFALPISYTILNKFDFLR